jgi:thiol-disulfide isomerase/thioredoxin
VYKTSYPITRPEMVSIELQDTSVITYMLPNDTLVVKIGLDSLDKNSNHFYIKIDDPVFDFMQNEKKIFGCYHFQSPLASQSFNSKPETQNDLEEAIERINNAQNDRLQFLENNKQQLPKWFIDAYKTSIIYYSAELKYATNFNLHNWDLNDKLPPTDVEINNRKAATSGFYWGFISDYFLLSHVVDNRLTGPSRMIALYNKASNKIDSALNREMTEYFNTYLLYTLYYFSESNNDLQAVDSFYYKNDFKLDDFEKTYVDNRRMQSLKKMEGLEEENRLMPGDKAPAFYLKDTANVFHTINDFRGNIVYLHFWATWCKPCLEEIPAINQLHKKLLNKPIIIVNICLDDKYDKWKEIIKTEKLEGVNLICKGNWASQLYSNYSFDQIPHYSIVDEMGLLISLDSKRPGDVYEELSALVEENQ